MKILIESPTGIALYRGNLTLGEHLVSDTFMDSRLNQSNSFLVDMLPREGYSYKINEGLPEEEIITVPPYVPPAMPEPWRGGAWKFVNGEFVIEPWFAEEVQQNKAKELQEQAVVLTQLRLDTFAQTRNYDGILSLCTYASSPVPKFAAEGQYGVVARDTTWAALYTIMQEVLAGTRPLPSGYSDIEPDLPPLVWPE